MRADNLSKALDDLTTGKRSAEDAIALLYQARIADLEAELQRYIDRFGRLPMPDETIVI